jgi:hypothetical protein
MECDDFTIDHHIDRTIEVKINPPDFADFG